MSRFRLWVLGVGLALMLAGPAWAWEVSFDGTFTWEYDVRGQLGSKGFFGPYNIDSGTTTLGRAASLNGWVGQQMGDMVAGTDGSMNIQYMQTNMELRITPAIRVRGSYVIGEWRDTGDADATGLGATVTSQYLNHHHQGTQRSFSPGYWNCLWGAAQLPWGMLTVGKRPFIFGMGLQFNGEENRANESLALAADYGPIRIQLGVYPSRRAEETNLVFQPPLGAFPPFTALDYYNNDYDKNNTRIWDLIVPTITYRSGPLDTGIIMSFVRTHRGPEGKLLPTVDVGNGSKQTTPTLDRTDFFGSAYVKYSTGSFFFNSEFAWYNRIDKFSGPQVLANSDTSLPVYIEAYRIAAESGVICGPSKVTFLYAWMNGPDRRNGQTRGINQGAFVDHINVSPLLVNTLPVVINPRIRQDADANTGVFRPYSFLMNYGYGFGAYINADTGNGYADDASIFAARLDYAVAANLNVFGSFMWADRVGNGYGWGYLSPLVTTATAWSGLAVAPEFNNGPSGQIIGRYRGSSLFTDGIASKAPNIPDNNLGWEVNTGFDWKILEGLIIDGNFGYWQPGKWFNYACVNKAVPGWDIQNGGVFAAFGAPPPGTFPFGVDPRRTIDAIWGMEMKASISF